MMTQVIELMPLIGKFRLSSCFPGIRSELVDENSMCLLPSVSQIKLVLGFVLQQINPLFGISAFHIGVPEIKFQLCFLIRLWIICVSGQQMLPET